MWQVVDSEALAEVEAIVKLFHDGSEVTCEIARHCPLAAAAAPLAAAAAPLSAATAAAPLAAAAAATP